MSRRFEQPRLDEYPINSTPGRFEVIAAHTDYRFMDEDDKGGRWLAILKVISTYRDNRTGEPVSQQKVMIVRWQWRQPTRWNEETKRRIPFGDYKWFQEQQMTLTGRKKWDEISLVVNQMFDEIEAEA